MAATGKLPASRTYAVGTCMRNTENVGKDGKGKGYTVCATKPVEVLPEKCDEMKATGKALDGWSAPGNSLEPESGGSFSNG